MDGAIHVAAGFCSGIISRTVTAPVERVKTEIQCSRSKETIKGIIKRILQSGGVRGLFQGNLVNCVKVGPQGAIWFGATESLKTRLPTKSMSCHSFISGSLAGAIAQTIVFPLEPVKSRLTVSNDKKYRGITHCLMSLKKEGGLIGIYRGWSPAMVGIIPYAGTDRGVYDFLTSHYEGKSIPAHVSLSCGLVSSSCGSIVSYPLALIRTRLQVQGMDCRNPYIYTSATDCFLKTVQHEGVLALWKGLLPNLAKAAPASSVGYCVYERSKERLQSLLVEYEYEGRINEKNIIIA